MLRRIYTLAIVVAIMSFPSALWAEDATSESAPKAAAKSGVYVGIKGGYSMMELNKNQLGFGGSYGGGHGGGHGARTSLGNEDLEAFSIGVMLGYKLQSLPLRLELDATYRNNRDDELTKRGSYTVQTWSGPDSYNLNTKLDINSYSTAMLNVWLDIPVGNFPVKPYVGGGAGVALLDYDTKITGTKNGGNINLSKSGTETAFAWNLGGGLGYAVTDSVTLDLGYRYTSGKKFKTSLSGNSASLSQRLEMRSHDMSLGLRYMF